jgi:hypothetical protein
MGRDQDHDGVVAESVLDEAPREVEAALLSERDVDEDDVGAQGLGLTKSLGAGRRDAGDGQALTLE